MLENYVVFFWLFRVCWQLLCVLTVVAWLGAIAVGIMWGVNVSEQDEYGTIEDVPARLTKLTKLFKRLFKVCIIVALSTSLLVIIAPTKAEVVSYLALQTIDDYNSTTENSNLTPESVVRVADDLVSVVQNSTTAVNNMLLKLEE